MVVYMLEVLEGEMFFFYLMSKALGRGHRAKFNGEENKVKEKKKT